MEVVELLGRLDSGKGYSLLLCPGLPPCVKSRHGVAPICGEVLGTGEVERLCYSVMPSQVRRTYETTG